MNVRQNIAFPLVAQGMPKAEIERRVMEAARTLQITDLLKSSVSGLSSGDRQRVALGRAIVRQPLAFLMDEPLGALDAEFREVMCHELRALHDRLSATTVYVTHDQTEAMSMADTIAIMNGGLIEQLGAPLEVYERPASVFVADFISSPPVNFLPFEGALSSLDAKLRDDLRLELKRIQQDLGATMLYVTHDQTEALTMATRVGVLQEGRLVQLGPPRQIYENPASSYVASRLGSPRINLLPRSAVGSIDAPPQAATVGIRAEHLKLSGENNTSNATACTARVLRIERLSDQDLVHLSLDGSKHELVAAPPTGVNVEPGDAVQVSLPQPLWFDTAGQRIAA